MEKDPKRFFLVRLGIGSKPFQEKHDPELGKVCCDS